MLIDFEKLQIFIKPGITDMRKQINGLSALLEEEDHELFSGNLFIFCNRYRNRLKILYWDKNGFCLWLKRLEKGKFPWPRNREEVEVINIEQLKMLLNGIDFFNAHESITFSNAS